VQEELKVLRDVSEKLEAQGIRYMLTGSVAMIYYAIPRMTRDIDIVVELSLSDAARFIRSFATEYYVSNEAVENSIKNQSLFNLLHNETIIKVDFVIRKESTYRRLEFERRKRVPLDGFQTWIVSREDLIISKLHWARESESERQLTDVRNLVSKDCDRDYIDQWTQELGLSQLWNRFRHD
jgi:predicted nucleotidyltransferase